MSNFTWLEWRYPRLSLFILITVYAYLGMPTSLGERGSSWAELVATVASLWRHCHLLRQGGCLLLRFYGVLYGASSA